MIRFEGISHSFGDRLVLDGIDLSFGQRRVAILGANGSGKTTLARMINGLQLPEKGRVLVDGIDPAKDARAVRRKVGFVFQNPDNQIVFPLVEEDLAFGLKNLRLPRDETSRRVDAALRRFGLSPLRGALVHTLSGGQKQMLAIAGVVAMEPEYIVFDEPTTLLDLRNRRLVGRTIAELDQNVVLVTHDLDLVADFDRVVVIDGGRVVCDDAPSPAVRFYSDLMR